MNIFAMKRTIARLMKPVGDDEGAGGAGGGDAAAAAAAASDAAAVARGDTLLAGAPAAVTDAAKADADAEAARILADAAKTAEGEGADPDAPKEGETAEQTAERVAAAAAKGGKAAMIPVERHKAMLDKAREERDALAAQLANQQKGATVVATNEKITAIETKVLAKEGEYNKALIDGEVEKATTLMREIRGMEREMGDLKGAMQAQAAETRAVEQVRYETAVERLEAAYPALNPDHESFDTAQVAEVMELQSAYKLTGMAPTAALQKAVKLIMGADTAAQKSAATVTPRVTAEEAAAATAAAAAAAKRTEDATKKAIDAANRTPASAAKIGVDSDKLGGPKLTSDAVMKMSQAQFAKLDDATLASLRGDDVV